MLLNSQAQGFIHLDKPYYSPGEQVNGTVSLLVNIEIQATHLVLRLNGGELVHFVALNTGAGSTNADFSAVDENLNEPKDNTLGSFNENHLFYDISNPIYNFHPPDAESNLKTPKAIIEPGQYQFPFSFRLGSDAPASFDYKWKMKGHRCEATVTYILTAILEDKTTDTYLTGGGDVLANTVMQVVPQGMGRPMNRKVQLEETVTDMCCMGKGSVKAAVLFDKDEYRIGGKAFLRVEVDNRRCQVDVRSIEAVLYQTLTFTAQGHQQSKTTELRKREVEGVKAGRYASGVDTEEIELPISGKKNNFSDIQPSCDGKLVECKHRIEVTLKMAGCCANNPTLRLDIPVYELVHNNEDLPDFMQKSNWNPNTQPVIAFNAYNSPNGENLDISVNPYTMVSHENEDFPLTNTYYRELKQKGQNSSTVAHTDDPKFVHSPYMDRGQSVIVPDNKGMPMNQSIVVDSFKTQNVQNTQASRVVGAIPTGLNASVYNPNQSILRGLDTTMNQSMAQPVMGQSFVRASPGKVIMAQPTNIVPIVTEMRQPVSLGTSVLSPGRVVVNQPVRIEGNSRIISQGYPPLRRSSPEVRQRVVANGPPRARVYV